MKKSINAIKLIVGLFGVYFMAALLVKLPPLFHQLFMEMNWI